MLHTAVSRTPPPATTTTMAQGTDGKGNKLTTLLGEQKALEAIKAGVAKQGW